MNGESARHDDRGATLVIVAVLAITILSFAALAVDLGWAYSVKRQLSSTADAVALAGAQEAGLRYRDTDGCLPNGTGYRPSDSLEAAIRSAVADTHAENHPNGSIGVPDPQITCDDLTSVTVSVTERSTLRTFFGGLMGVDALNPAAAATANVSGYTEQGGLRPFTVCLADLTAGSVKVDGKYPTMDSIYAGSGESSETLAGGGNSSWAAGSGVITTTSDHKLSVGDLVRTDVRSGGGTDGFYYVGSTPTNKSLTLATVPVLTTASTNLVVPSAAGTVDLFKQTTYGPAGGGLATIAGATPTVITTPSVHDLGVGDYVQVWSTLNGTIDGQSPPKYYYVISTPSNKSITVSTVEGSSSAFSFAAPDKVFIYKSDPNAQANTTNCGSNFLGAPGNWGYARFGLSGNQPTLLCLIEKGYGPSCGGSAAIDLGDDAGSTTGLGNSGDSLQVPAGQGGQATSDLVSYMNNLLGQTILLPVADTWYEQGQNANYRAYGGVPVEFCGYIFPTSNQNPTPNVKGTAPGDCWKDTLYQAAIDAGNMEGASLYIQWRRAAAGMVQNYVGQSDDDDSRCDLRKDGCVASLRLVR